MPSQTDSNPRRARSPEVFSVHDLRNRSSALLRDADEGRLAIITEHGRPAILALPFDERLLRQGVSRAAALALFEAGLLTLAQSARLAELSLEDFIELLGELGIAAVDYPADELASELEAAL